MFSTISELPAGYSAKISEIAVDENCRVCLKPILYMLQGLGVLLITEEHIMVKSITSSLFIKSFKEYIINNLSILTGWEDLKGKPLQINEQNVLLSEAFLYSMEKKRVDLLGPEANVLKVYDICRVAFKAKINNRVCYLMQYGFRTNNYALIGGGIEPSDRNAYAAMIREISEELPEAGLKIDTNYKLKEILRSEQKDKFISNKYGVYTGYNMTIYLAYDVDPSVLKKIDNKMNSWISEKEIKKGIANDGKAIFPIKDDLMDALRTSARSFEKGAFNLVEWIEDHKIEAIVSLLASILGIVALFLQK
jgi:8-oxo-dGTP pyrophosphatase MutT (NUDIX family)